MNYMLTKSVLRRNRKIFNQPIKVSDLDFIDRYEDISKDWEARAQALLVRRRAKVHPLNKKVAIRTIQSGQTES